ncbi:SDR family NAD(P)-dependent oxidoreductase [Streptomyces sp. NPDC054804]
MTALPVLRKQRAAISSRSPPPPGLIGRELRVAYAASKFGVEGWMESLRYNVEPHNIRTTVVEPGSFRRA